MALELNNNFSPDRGISFIVFFKDLDDEPIKTAKEICMGVSRITKVEFEIIFVRDGGRENTQVEKFLSANKNLKLSLIELTHSLGVSNAIRTAANSVSYSHVCFVPGNDQFTEESYFTVASNFDDYDALLGFRKNLIQVRPLPKIIASKLSLAFAKILFFPKLGFLRDIHGLNVYKTRFVKSYICFGRGHGNNISLIIPMLWSGAKFAQIEVVLKQSRQTLKAAILKFPIPKEVLNFSRDLLRLFCKYRFKKVL